VPRSYSTLKRSYFKEEGELLREDDVKVQIEMPVRSGMLDDKLLREVCRPKPGLNRPGRQPHRRQGQRGDWRTAQSQRGAGSEGSPARQPANPGGRETRARAQTGNVLTRRADARHVRRGPGACCAALLRQSHHAHCAERGLVDQRRPPPCPASHAHVHWAYEGEGGPENWGKLKPEYATCDTGKRQSPIDIRDGFPRRPRSRLNSAIVSQLRVIDNGHTIQVEVAAAASACSARPTSLIQFHFHRPSEERVNGRSFDMVAHLVHKSVDGSLAVLAVLLEKGMENPLIQTVWNNLPLEKNEYVTPPGWASIVAQLLPEDRSYYTYMGSLTTPPCSEGVLWLVLKQPQQISPSSSRFSPACTGTMPGQCSRASAG
jgi:carbonic anhydrase